MNGTQVNRMIPIFSGMTSRRRVFAALSALSVFRAQARDAAGQLEVPACNAESDICTHLMGCCTGLICATSAINPNYGVCIPGEGEHAAVTSAIVVPFNDGITAETAAGLVEAEAAEAEVVALVAEQEAAEDARRTKHRTRKDNKRAKRRARLDTNRAARRAR